MSLIGAFSRYDVLEFDIDDLNEQATKIAKIASDLQTAQGNLTKCITQLRSDWQTAAGDKFFEQYDENWCKNLDNHIKLLNDLAQALRYAAQQYEPIATECSKLTFG